MGGQIWVSVSSEISEQLAYLNNESFESGQVPSSLKNSRSIPVFENKESVDE